MTEPLKEPAAVNSATGKPSLSKILCVLLPAVIALVTIFSLKSCVPPTVIQGPPLQKPVTQVTIHHGTVTSYDSNGNTTVAHFQPDSTLTIHPDGTITGTHAGIIFCPVVGISWTGKQFSPYIGLRLTFLYDIGLCVGVDDQTLSIGPDYRIGNVLIGIQLGQPYNVGPTRLGARLALAIK